MSAYLIADIKVTNDGWVPGYAASFHDLVAKNTVSKYLSRSGNVRTLEGQPLNTTLIAVMRVSVGGGGRGLRHRS